MKKIWSKPELYAFVNNTKGEHVVLACKDKLTVDEGPGTEGCGVEVGCEYDGSGEN